MKKVIICLALFAILAAGTVFADHPGGFGIGAQYGGGGYWGVSGYHSNFAVSLKFPNLPVFWAVTLDINTGYFGLGISGDVYFIDTIMVPKINLNWYLGIGASVGLSFSSNYFGLKAAARLPVGISWQPIPFFEVFLQVVPSLGIDIVPSFHFPSGGIGGDIGIRLWI